jgi:hypothetical protein
MEELIFVFAALSIICQFLALYISYEIYKYDKFSKWWLAMILAFFLQFIRRVVSMYNDANLSTFSSSAILDRAFMFFISLFMLIGLWQILRYLETSKTK